MPETAEPLVLPDVGQEEETKSKEDLEPGYLVICWDDPVNLMDYVTHVFQTVFGWTKQKAEFHMLQVHNQGKSVLTRESLEKAEHYVHQLQKYTLHATMERDWVKFLKVDGENLVFQLGRREKDLLLELLKMYPVVPESHHRISNSPESAAMLANQKLLEEALAEHRKERKAELEAMLSSPQRFREASSGYRLFLTAEQREWLLQVLNDVRVGCWLNLGSPDEKQGQRLHLSLQNAR